MRRCVGLAFFSALVGFIAAGSTRVVAETWEEIGDGVGYRSLGTGQSVVIAYGGYGVTDALSRHWLDRLLSKSSLASESGVGHAYAVRGPDHPSYPNLEIENSALVRFGYFFFVGQRMEDN
ncbi:unnamed protein product [Darwinula stevensoni]|uniref:Uncharacterized protein n=1 Tax=Darwinula stevensoni TaxID=69355 RepID=A0A7R9A4T5_9CRUS|nr:unnamed protein product [Darwinula stevensoni]CAG0890630.1 unnamed protein product [Darwinula stevensoni]